VGYSVDNGNATIWMLDEDVNRWGIQLTMEMPHIEWCFQFDKWMGLDNVKYAHFVNLKAYKDDPHKVLVFVSIPFSTSQVDIISEISNMDDSLHLKSCER
jgi:hypothetical protein